MLGSMKVLLSSFVPLTMKMPDGTTKPRLFMMIKRPIDMALLPMGFEGSLLGPIDSAPARTETVILVHPDRWDAFWMAVNQPDIFAHPEVRALLLPEGRAHA